MWVREHMGLYSGHLDDVLNLGSKGLPGFPFNYIYIYDDCCILLVTDYVCIYCIISHK